MNRFTLFITLLLATLGWSAHAQTGPLTPSTIENPSYVSFQTMRTGKYLSGPTAGEIANQYVEAPAAVWVLIDATSDLAEGTTLPETVKAMYMYNPYTQTYLLHGESGDNAPKLSQNTEEKAIWYFTPNTRVTAENAFTISLSAPTSISSDATGNLVYFEGNNVCIDSSTNGSTLGKWNAGDDRNDGNTWVCAPVTSLEGSVKDGLMSAYVDIAPVIYPEALADAAVASLDGKSLAEIQAAAADINTAFPNNPSNAFITLDNILYPGYYMSMNSNSLIAQQSTALAEVWQFVRDGDRTVLKNYSTGRYVTGVNTWSVQYSTSENISDAAQIYISLVKGKTNVIGISTDLTDSYRFLHCAAGKNVVSWVLNGADASQWNVTNVDDAVAAAQQLTELGNVKNAFVNFPEGIFTGAADVNIPAVEPTTPLADLTSAANTAATALVAVAASGDGKVIAFKNGSDYIADNGTETNLVETTTLEPTSGWVLEAISGEAAFNLKNVKSGRYIGKNDTSTEKALIPMAATAADASKITFGYNNGILISTNEVYPHPSYGAHSYIHNNDNGTITIWGGNPANSHWTAEKVTVPTTVTVAPETLALTIGEAPADNTLTATVSAGEGVEITPGFDGLEWSKGESTAITLGDIEGQPLQKSVTLAEGATAGSATVTVSSVLKGLAIAPATCAVTVSEASVELTAVAIKAGQSVQMTAGTPAEGQTVTPTEFEIVLEPNEGATLDLTTGTLALNFTPAITGATVTATPVAEKANTVKVTVSGALIPSGTYPVSGTYTPAGEGATAITIAAANVTLLPAAGTDAIIKAIAADPNGYFETCMTGNGKRYLTIANGSLNRTTEKREWSYMIGSDIIPATGQAYIGSLQLTNAGNKLGLDGDNVKANGSTAASTWYLYPTVTGSFIITANAEYTYNSAKSIKTPPSGNNGYFAYDGSSYLAFLYTYIPGVKDITATGPTSAVVLPGAGSTDNPTFDIAVTFEPTTAAAAVAAGNTWAVNWTKGEETGTVAITQPTMTEGAGTIAVPYGNLEPGAYTFTVTYTVVTNITKTATFTVTVEAAELTLEVASAVADPATVNVTLGTETETEGVYTVTDVPLTATVTLAEGSKALTAEDITTTGEAPMLNLPSDKLTLKENGVSVAAKEGEANVYTVTVATTAFTAFESVQATLSFGEGKTATWSVTTVAPVPALQSIVLKNGETVIAADAAPIELTLGEGNINSVTVTASANPADAELGTITWAPAESDFVTVTPSEDNTSVTVTAKAATSEAVIITATSGEKTASFKVTVVNPVKPVDGITATAEVTDLVLAETTEGEGEAAVTSMKASTVINGTYTPADATEFVIGNVKATVAPGEGLELKPAVAAEGNAFTMEVIATKAGKYTVTVMYGDDISSAPITFTVSDPAPDNFQVVEDEITAPEGDNIQVLGSTANVAFNNAGAEEPSVIELPVKAEEGVALDMFYEVVYAEGNEDGKVIAATLTTSEAGKPVVKLTQAADAPADFATVIKVNEKAQPAGRADEAATEPVTVLTINAHVNAEEITSMTFNPSGLITTTGREAEISFATAPAANPGRVNITITPEVSFTKQDDRITVTFDKAGTYVIKATVEGTVPAVTNTMTVKVNTGSPVSGIEAVNAEAADGRAEIYDLAGRRLTRISAAGVYIVNGEKTFVR